MGRYVSGGAQARKLTVLKTTSAPAITVPSWARVAYITACGPGQGGANATTANVAGNGGHAGAFAIRAPMPINGAATIAVVIGAPSVGAAASSNTAAANAGITTVTIGGCVLTLEGGRQKSLGGARAYWGVMGSTTAQNGETPFGSANIAASARVLSNGAVSGETASGENTVAKGLGAGAASPFGGSVAQAVVANNTPGANATGYGAGGQGGNGTGKGGDGAPSFVLIEFEEAA